MNIVVIVYFIGIIIGAIFFNLWGTGNLIKPLIALLWTALFLIAIVYVDRPSSFTGSRARFKNTRKKTIIDPMGKGVLTS